MQTTNKSGVAAFVNECVKHGMRHVVCSPGSRNAPLVIAFDEHPEIETFVIHDERCAAFYAMGMAQQLNAPVGITCTSGSAMLNYYPAVAEAYYQSIPLVVISADRPEEWVNQGDGQTIVQKGVYTNHIRFEGVIHENINQDFNHNDLEKLLKVAFQECNGNWKGPIHFNVPINEPLYGTVEVETSDFTPYKVETKTNTLSEKDLNFISENWSKYDKKLILCGQLSKNQNLLNKLAELSNNTSVAILVENTSNLTHPSFIHCIDRTLECISENEVENFQPDLLVTIGGAVVSKRIKHFLRKSNIQQNWKIGFEFHEMDTYQSLTKSFQVQPVQFIEAVLSFQNNVQSSMFGANWKQKDFIAQDRLSDFFHNIPYSDLSVFETILDYIPEDAFLHMGNSSVVRYCQLFDPIRSIRYFSNRGTSGIDGCTSTACGVALMSPSKRNILITGDVSFFYDSNALWSNHLPPNLHIILINNNGGGIFKIIDGPTSTHQSEKFFEAKHQFTAEHLCKAFGVHYSCSNSVQDIENEMTHFFEIAEDQKPKLLEIHTPSELNHTILKEFFNTIQKS